MRATDSYNKARETPLQPRADPYYLVRTLELRQIAKGIRQLGLPARKARNIADRLVQVAEEIERRPGGAHPGAPDGQAPDTET